MRLLLVEFVDGMAALYENLPKLREITFGGVLSKEDEDEGFDEEEQAGW
jgi:hypothetical protein